MLGLKKRFWEDGSFTRCRCIGFVNWSGCGNVCHDLTRLPRRLALRDAENMQSVLFLIQIRRSASGLCATKIVWNDNRVTLKQSRQVLQSY